MPSMSRGCKPASAIAFETASHAIDSVVRLEGRIWGVSPTPTMQYLSVSAPICFLTVCGCLSGVDAAFYRGQPAPSHHVNLPEPIGQRPVVLGITPSGAVRKDSGGYCPVPRGRSKLEFFNEGGGR